MPFCGAFLAGRAQRFWFPAPPAQWGCVSARAQQQPGCASPAAREGFCLQLCSLSLITCRIRSVLFQTPAQPLWRAVSFLLSARLVDNAAHEVVEHRALPPLRVVGFSSFPLWLVFFSIFCQENCFLEENSLFLIQLQVVNYPRLTNQIGFSNKSPGALSVVCSISCMQAIQLILFYKSHF